MKESQEVTEAKKKWVEEYFLKNPGHSADRCNARLRKKFAHGLAWTTVQNIKRQVVSGLVNGHAKVTEKAASGKQLKLVAVSDSDPALGFKAALMQFRSQVRALQGVKLRSLVIRLDENTGKWDIEYDLASTETQVTL